MNPYLTSKAINRKLTWIPIGFSFLFGIVGGFSLIEDFGNGTLEADVGFVELFIVLLSLLPAVLKVRKMYRIWMARKLAVAFTQSLEAEVSCKNVEQLTGLTDVIDKTLRLLEAGFLQNVIVDIKEQEFFLYAPNLQNQQETILNIQCPSCGAANQVVLGKLNSCAFCGSPLNVPGYTGTTDRKGRFFRR